MALQIRRGTNAERILITPLPGELIYVTDYLTAPPGTNAVYVGDGSTLGGTPVAATPTLAGNLVGNINLNNFQINGTGSISITGNISNTGNITTNGNILGTGNISRTGNLTLTGSAAVTANITAGAFIGELIGSVFSDDSSQVLVNAIDNSLYGERVTVSNGSNAIVISNNSIIFNTSNPTNTISIGTEDNPTGLTFNADRNVTINALCDTNAPSQIFFNTFMGNFDVKQDVQEGLAVGGISVLGYSQGVFGFAGTSGFFAEDQTGAAVGQAPSTFIVGSTSAAVDFNNGDYLTAEGALRFTSEGILKVPVIRVGSYNNAGETGITPEIGMIIYNTSTNKFRGYSNTGWVDLS